MSQHTCLLERPSCYLSYKFQLFSLRFAWGYALLYFSHFELDRSGQTNHVRGYVVLCDFVNCFGRILAHSHQPSAFHLLFSSEACFSKLLNCIPAYSLSLLLDYHQYIISFEIKSPIIRSILRYDIVKLVVPYMLFLTFILPVNVLSKFKYVWCVLKTYYI